MKKKVDFLIAGSKKCGTTAIYEFLRQHPDIFFPKIKEISYFSNDKIYNKGVDCFDAFYRNAGNECLFGGADIEALFLSHSAERIYQYNPEMKIIVVLRNPVDRAYSAYWYAVRFGWEEGHTFEDELSMDEKRMNGSSIEKRKSYLTYGHYSDQLKHFIDIFGQEKIKILLNDDLRKSPDAVIKDTIAWLGLNSDITKIDVKRKVNVARNPRFKRLEKFLYNPNSPIKLLLRKATTPELRHSIATFLKKPLLIINAKPFTYPPMKQETRAYLIEYFKPWNKELSKLIGKNLDHWNM